jgi:hypothetical protein
MQLNISLAEQVQQVIFPSGKFAPVAITLTDE